MNRILLSFLRQGYFVNLAPLYDKVLVYITKDYNPREQTERAEWISKEEIDNESRQIDLWERIYWRQIGSYNHLLPSHPINPKFKQLLLEGWQFNFRPTKNGRVLLRARLPLYLGQSRVIRLEPIINDLATDDFWLTVFSLTM